jgi:hypothetical protein
MKMSSCAAVALTLAILATSAHAATHTSGLLTPFRNTTTRGGYAIDTVGDTLGQARPENTRLIIRVFAPDKKIVKPAQIALVDKSGALINQPFEKIARLATKKIPACRYQSVRKPAPVELALVASVWISTRSLARKEVTLTPRSIGRRQFLPVTNDFRSRCQTDRNFCCR